MKASINPHGVIELIPENRTEAYAIEQITEQKEILIRVKNKEFTGLETLKEFKRTQ